MLNNGFVMKAPNYKGDKTAPFLCSIIPLSVSPPQKLGTYFKLKRWISRCIWILISFAERIINKIALPLCLRAS